MSLPEFLPTNKTSCKKLWECWIRRFKDDKL